MDDWLIVWIALAAGFALLELATVAFVALYFAIGAIAAAIVAAADADLVWQLLAFIAASSVLLALTRPVLKRRLEATDVPMNVHALIGRSGIVTIPVDNDANTGQIRVGTDYWTARLPEGGRNVIAVGTRVLVISVEGVTARVEPLPEAPSA